MSFRRKLLVMFVLAVFVSIVTVSFLDSLLARRTFERADAERAGMLVAQFRREFQRRASEVARRVDAIANSESASRIALELGRGSPNLGAFVNQAKEDARAQQLDLLEYVAATGTIISSAQAPAKFGYKESLLSTAGTPRAPFLKTEDSPSALGLCAVREVRVGDAPLFIVGGETLDRDFLTSFEVPPPMRIMLYSRLQPEFAPQLLVDRSGTVKDAARLQPLVESVLQHGDEETQTIAWSSDAADREAVHAIPLRGDQNQVLGVLLIGNSLRPLLQLERSIRSLALLVASVGIVIAILLSGWVAARVTRPVEQMAAAAQQVASGDWTAYVDATSRDELGQLADSFNRMTRELLDQQQRLVQAERVAAWRELARRLAHELKNPLFPLQITVENLLRARERDPGLFDEIFRESASTLLAEIANLKAIIGRFSEFSKMPQPQLQPVNLNDAVRRVARLFEAELRAPGRQAIDCQLQLEHEMPAVDADPELLHRALSNLVLNAMDAMPAGGVLTMLTRSRAGWAQIQVSDTGKGLTREECERLFTPYYTTKSHGTGLGLAIVQSVISDHQGRISVQSELGRGTTFVIELPAGAHMLASEASASRQNG